MNTSYVVALVLLVLLLGAGFAFDDGDSASGAKPASHPAATEKAAPVSTIAARVSGVNAALQAYRSQGSATVKLTPRSARVSSRNSVVPP